MHCSTANGCRRCTPEMLLLLGRREVCGYSLPRHRPDQTAHGPLMLRFEEGSAHIIIAASHGQTWGQNAGVRCTKCARAPPMFEPCAMRFNCWRRLNSDADRKLDMPHGLWTQSDGAARERHCCAAALCQAVTVASNVPPLQNGNIVPRDQLHACANWQKMFGLLKGNPCICGARCCFK